MIDGQFCTTPTTKSPHTNSSHNSDKLGCGGKGCDLGGNTKVSSYSSDTPNPPIGGLVLTGVILTGGVFITEILLTWAEVAMVPVAVAEPIIGVPLEAVLVACSMAILDIEVSYSVYVYRVIQDPNERQKLELLPPWGLGED